MRNYDLFESYIYKKLSADELIEFENRLFSDADFKADYEDHIQVQQALDILVEDDIATVIEKIKNKETQTGHSNNENIKSIIPKRWMIIAAAFLFLLSIGFVFKDKLNSNKDSIHIEGSQYAIAYFDSFNPTMTRSGNGEDDEDIYTAYGKKINASFIAEKYSEAADLLRTLMSAYPNTSYHDKAEWNLAVAYAQYDKSKALIIIDEILADPEHDYHDIDRVQKLKKLLK